MKSTQQMNPPQAQTISLEELPRKIFGISTQDALTVCMGVAMAAIGINRIINSNKSNK